MTDNEIDRIKIPLTKHQRAEITGRGGGDVDSLLLVSDGRDATMLLTPAPFYIDLTDEQKEIVKKAIGRSIDKVRCTRMGWSGDVPDARGRFNPGEKYKENCQVPVPSAEMCGPYPTEYDSVRCDIPMHHSRETCPPSYSWIVFVKLLLIPRYIEDILDMFRDVVLGPDMSSIGGAVIQQFVQIQEELGDLFKVQPDLAIQASSILEKNAPLLDAAVKLKIYPNASELGFNVTIPNVHCEEAVQFLGKLESMASVSPSLTQLAKSTSHMLNSVAGGTIQDAIDLLDRKP
jgi:hypothetical protein